MYNQSDEQIKSILDIWKIIELSTLPKNEKASVIGIHLSKIFSIKRQFTTQTYVKVTFSI